MAPRAQCGYNTFKSDDPNPRNSLLLDLQEMGVRFCLQTSRDDLEGIFSDEFSEYPPTHFLVNQYRTLILL